MESESRSVFPGFADDVVTADPGELVRALTERRRQQGLSQTDVATRMGTSQSAVARVESGSGDLRLSTLRRYAAAVDAEVGFAVGDRSSGDRR